MKESNVVVAAAATTNAKVFDAVLPAASVTFTTMLSVSAVPGVPLIAPVLALIEDQPPVLGVFEVIDHVYAPDPPLAAIVVEYSVPVVAPGRGEAVEIAKFEAIVIEKVFVVVLPTLSVTRTEIDSLSALVGVPLIMPLEAPSEIQPPVFGVADTKLHV